MPDVLSTHTSSGPALAGVCQHCRAYTTFGSSYFFLALGLGPIETHQERCEDYVRDNLPGWKDAISTNTGGGWTPRYECWATDPGGARARVY